MIIPMGVFGAYSRREVHGKIMLGAPLLNLFWFMW